MFQQNVVNKVLDLHICNKLYKRNTQVFILKDSFTRRLNFKSMDVLTEFRDQVKSKPNNPYFLINKFQVLGRETVNFFFER